MDHPEFLTNLPASRLGRKIIGSRKTFIVLKAPMASGKTLLTAEVYRLAQVTSVTTQPLIENTIGTANFLNTLMAQEVGTFAGFSTGEFKNYTGHGTGRTKALYATEALQLPRLLFRRNLFDFLFIDEFDQFSLAG